MSHLPALDFAVQKWWSVFSSIFLYFPFFSVGFPPCVCFGGYLSIRCWRYSSEYGEFLSPPASLAHTDTNTQAAPIPPRWRPSATKMQQVRKNFTCFCRCFSPAGFGEGGRGVLDDVGSRRLALAGTDGWWEGGESRVKGGGGGDRERGFDLPEVAWRWSLLMYDSREEGERCEIR